MRKLMKLTLLLVLGVVLFAAACVTPEDPQADPQAIVNEALTKLVMPEEITAEMTKIEPALPDDAKYEDIEISMSSTDTEVIKDDGTIIRSFEDKEVSVTVTLTLDGKTASKKFDYTVGADAAEIVDADLAGLSLLAAAIGDIDLPTEGVYGSTITWSSSDTAVIDNEGKVTRAADVNKRVTLTATVTKGSVSKTKLIDVTVLKTSGDVNGVFALASKNNQMFYLEMVDGEVWLTYEGIAFVDPEATERTIEFALDHTPGADYSGRTYNGDTWFENEIEGNGMQFRFKINVSEAYKDIDPGEDWIKFIVRVTEKKGDTETVTFLKKENGNNDGCSACYLGDDSWPDPAATGWSNGQLVELVSNLVDKHENRYDLRVEWAQIHIRKNMS